MAFDIFNRDVVLRVELNERVAMVEAMIGVVNVEIVVNAKIFE